MNAAATFSKTPAIAPSRIIEAFGALRRIDMSRVTDLKNRSGSIVWPRHELSFLLWSLGGLSYADIGTHTGGRDPSSVMNSLQRINQRRDDDHAYLQSLESLMAQVMVHSAVLGADAPQVAVLACRVMSEPDLNRADVEALAVCVLSAVAILEAGGLSDAGARRAALGVLCRDGGRANG